MGLGRLYDPGSGTLQSLGTGRGADLQLVELVCAAGAPENAAGSHHVTPHAARRGGPADSACRSNTTSADLDPCRRRSDQNHDSQCAQGVEHRSRNCASVNQIRVLASTHSLHHCKYHRRKTKISPASRYPDGNSSSRRFRVTEENRLIVSLVVSLIAPLVVFLSCISSLLDLKKIGAHPRFFVKTRMDAIVLWSF